MKHLRSLVLCCFVAVLSVSCTTTPKHPAAIPSTSTPSPTETPAVFGTPTKTPLPPKLPGGLVVVDSSWISDNVGWVLGGRGCRGPSCSALMRTDDGGVHWRRLSLPPAFVFAKGQYPQGSPTPEIISRIRFANPDVGYAFDPSLFMTLDGGRTWRRQGAPRSVASLEISQGNVVRISYPNSGCPGPCNPTVERSQVGSTIWHHILTPTGYEYAFSVAIRGSNIDVAAFGNPAGGANDAHTSFWRSSDLGASWANFDDPCGESTTGENDAADFIPVPGHAFIVECRPRGADADAFVVESTNGGASFGVRRLLHVKVTDALAAPSVATIAVAYNGNGLGVLVSHDSGRTWRSTLVVTPAPDSEQPRSFSDSKSVNYFLGFQDASTARTSFGTAFIWTTRDGGNTWRRSAPFAGL